MRSLIVNEGGINWRWYAHLNIDDENQRVKIVRYYRLHKFDDDQGANKHPESIKHPGYYREQIWKEDEKRTALEYFVPEKGWYKISNPKHIFDYK